jgi:hypothetical protein
MAKKTKTMAESKTEQPSWKFKINNEEYLVFAKDDDLKVTCDGKIVFDKFKSKLSYIQWINTINK